eukprot:7382347-Prymnesium_polylepis.1
MTRRKTWNGVMRKSSGRGWDAADEEAARKEEIERTRVGGTRCRGERLRKKKKHGPRRLETVRKYALRG